MYEIVTHTCPTCGFQWAQREEIDDEWFKLTTHSELCEACMRAYFEQVRKDREDLFEGMRKENEVLLGWSGNYK